MQPLNTLDWEPAEIITLEPKPAINGNTVKITLTITNPFDLNDATKVSPFKVNTSEFIIEGILHIGEETKLEKVLVNGFDATIGERIDWDLGGPHLIPFQKKVLLESIDHIHIEVIDENGKSQGSWDFPIKKS